MLNHDIDADIPQRYALDIKPPAADAATLAEIRRMILAAKRPVIHAGAGIKWARASAKLAALAEKLQIPVTSSAGHADILPMDFQLHAGGVGPRGNPVASTLTRDADLTDFLPVMATASGENAVEAAARRETRSAPATRRRLPRQAPLSAIRSRPCRICHA